MPIINSVIAGGGTTPTGTISITSNGTHDVTNYATADVNVPTTAPAHYVEKRVDSNGVLVNGENTLSLAGVVTIGKGVLQYCYQYRANIATGNNWNVVDFSNVENVEEEGCYCMYLSNESSTPDTKLVGTPNLGKLKSVGASGFYQAFRYRKGLTGVVKIGDGLNSVGASAFYQAFYECDGLTGVDAAGITEVANKEVFCHTFENCSNLTGIVDLSGLTIVGIDDGSCRGGQFAYCFRYTAITGVDLSNLTFVENGYSRLSTVFEGSFREAFAYDGLLEWVDLSSLEKIGYNNTGSLSTVRAAFFHAFVETKISTMSLKSLKTLASYSLYEMFYNCAYLQDLWFYALDANSFGSYTNQFYNMLSGCTNVTVHFPIRIQSTIGSWSDVTNGFGGTNTTVLFDIVTTLTGADGNTYTRQEKDSTTTATAWVYNDTLYYTSGVSNHTAGVNEPAVSDAIYSDAACTQSVTTITAVA